MQATLQILTGPETGRKIHLKTGQMARFGRTEWSDFAFPYDPRLADVHFSIETSDDAVTLADLSQGKGVEVDGKKVASCRLRSGQKVRAGSLIFGVATETLFDTSATGTGPIASVGVAAAPAAPVALARDVCKNVDLSAPARELLDETIGVLPFIERLAAKDRLLDALRVLAAWLNKRKAVWWAADCVESVCGDHAQAQAGLVALARGWASDPTEEHRRAAMSAAEAADTRLPACWVAYGAGWSGGSLAPAELPAVPPDEQLSAQAVTSSLLLAAVFFDPAQAAANYRSFVDQGKKIAGTVLEWEAARDGP